MTHHFSSLKCTTILAQKVSGGSTFSGAHAISLLVSVFQAQLACKAGRPRFSSVRLAITRLLNAQATNRR